MSNEREAVFTRYKESTQTKNYSTGHEILSESIGLMLLYYVEENEQKHFDALFDFAKENMYIQNTGFRWRIGMKDGSKTFHTTVVDDMRILKAMMGAYEKWKSPFYKKWIQKLAQNIKIHYVKGKYIFSDYDAKNKLRSPSIEFSYLDLGVMKRLAQTDNEWEGIYKKNKDLVLKQSIKGTPLFKKNTQFSENEPTKKVYMIDSALVVLHLVEAGYIQDEWFEWIENELSNNQKIVGIYDGHTQTPIESYESTAIYSILARACYESKHFDLYQLLIKKMLSLQVKDKNSPIYGAFGDVKKLEVYSYDNLQAILALRREV